MPVDFKWTAGDLIDMGEVDVSLDPVSTRGDANFDDENVPTPRFVASNNPMTIISVSPCKTTLLFPFVTASGWLLYRNRRYEYFGAKWRLRRHFHRGQSTY